jgi:monoamine oxidase
LKELGMKNAAPMPMNKSYDVIILGAGASGLLSARTLAEAGLRVAVLEARNRAGGRMCTGGSAGSPIELGAEFVHGEATITKSLLKESGMRMQPLEGRMYQYKYGKLKEQEDFIEKWDELQEKLDKLTDDISVQSFIDHHLACDEWTVVSEQVKRYAEGYYAADLTRASSFALRRELSSGDHEDDMLLVSGYGPLAEYLHRKAEAAGAEFYFDTVAANILWSPENVTVHSNDGRVFKASRLMYTLPLGIWQAQAIAWSPALPEKDAAVQELGFGCVQKITLEFRHPFWEEEAKELGFLFSSEAIPTWWHGLLKNSLTGWVGGPRAGQLSVLSKEGMTDLALHSLSAIFKIPQERLSVELLAAHHHDWTSDPYTRGAYSFEVVSGSHYQEIFKKPVAGTVYFAGEALYDGPLIGTVEGAFMTAKSATDLILGK